MEVVGMDTLLSHRLELAETPGSHYAGTAV